MDFEIKDLNSFFNSIVSNNSDKIIEKPEVKGIEESISTDKYADLTLEKQIQGMRKTVEDLDNALKKVDKDKLMEEEIELLNCGCKDSCERHVPFCCSVKVPSGFRLFPILPPAVNLFTFDTSCLKCVVEPHEIEAPCIPNPCSGQPPITGCTVKIDKVKIVGDIKFFANVGIITSSCFNGIATLCCSDSVCVNNIIGYTCKCHPCPDLCDVKAKDVCVTNVDVDRCGNKVITIKGKFELPCVE